MAWSRNLGAASNRFLARRGWFARLPGGGESRDIWRLGPVCIKRWSPRIPRAEVRLRCRVSREITVCNRMWYVPWLHWTVARWVVGQPASHEACNRLLARIPGLRDLHPANVVVGRNGVVVVDFGVRDTAPHDDRNCHQPEKLTRRFRPNRIDPKE